MFIFAYEILRAEQKSARDPLVLTMAHLRAAHLSLKFQVDRKIVEACRSDLLNIGMEDPNYRCPFDLPPSQIAAQKIHADRLRQKEINRSQDRDMRTQAEREDQKQAAKSAPKSALSCESKPKKAPGIRRPQSADELLRGLGKR